MEKVSVIIPAYNKSELTVRTINSVLEQTYQNLEVIVVDDGSTDDTKEKLAGFGKKIKYIYKENGGACSARNLGIQESTGDFIGLLDCDDLYYPEKISKCVDFLNKHNDSSVVFTAAYFIDLDDNIVNASERLIPTDQKKLRESLLLSNIFCNSTIVARRTCFDSVGLYDERVFIPADWDMWIRLSECFKIGYINEKLTGYRITDSYTNGNLELAIKEAIYVIDKTFQRKSSTNFKLKKHSIANVFSGYGLAFAAARNFSKARKYLAASLLYHPFKLNILLYLILLYISPRLLYRLILLRNSNYRYSIKK